MLNYYFFQGAMEDARRYLNLRLMDSAVKSQGDISRQLSGNFIIYNIEAKYRKYYGKTAQFYA